MVRSRMLGPGRMIGEVKALPCFSFRCRSSGKKLRARAERPAPTWFLPVLPQGKQPKSRLRRMK